VIELTTEELRRVAVIENAVMGRITAVEAAAAATWRYAKSLNNGNETLLVVFDPEFFGLEKK